MRTSCKQGPAKLSLESMPSRDMLYSSRKSASERDYLNLLKGTKPKFNNAARERNLKPKLSEGINSSFLKSDKGLKHFSMLFYKSEPAKKRKL